MRLPPVPARLRPFLGPLVALAAIGAIEALAWTPYRLPNAPAVILLAVVFSAFVSGFWPGLFTAGVAWAYFAYFFSIHGQSGQLFAYSRDDYLRVATWAVATPAMALMVGVLKSRAEALAREIERKRAEERMAQSEKMAAVGQLAARAAHEINNPLTSLMGYLERLRTKVGGDPKAAEALERVERATLRIRDLAGGLLSLARASRMERGPVRLAEVLEESRKTLEPELEKRGVKVDWRVRDGLPPVGGSAEHLQQVFTNLMRNAGQAMGSGGMLTVAAGNGGAEVRVSVTDTGTGIPPEVLPRIFEPFFTTKPRGEGTGLGLAIVQSVVAQHGGRVEVRSEVGKGSTFTVILPAGRDGAHRSGGPVILPVGREGTA